MPLKRSNKKMIAGVCGGIAEWLHWDPTVVTNWLCVIISVKRSISRHFSLCYFMGNNAYQRIQKDCKEII